ncbi:MAG: hypothetical protein JXP34_09805 [Planctomycetes bacterium]|nr:hypothetical protein [Planctomycetota bacterium]
MRFARILVLSVAVAWVAAAPCLAGGLAAEGNVDGVLVWRLGPLAPRGSAREVVIFSFDRTYDAVAKRIEAARAHFASLPDPAPPTPGPAATGAIWIRNDATDFALEDWSGFLWRMKRQALACPAGGQLSQFAYYLHYWNLAGEQRAGTPNEERRPLENLRVAEPVRARGEGEAAGIVETADGILRVRIRAALGPGGTAGVEFVVTNIGAEPLADVRLSAYANVEAAHTHESDLSVLDARTGGILVIDPPTELAVVMTGLGRPALGYAGTWNSWPLLREGRGIASDDWKPFAGVSAEMRKKLARLAARANAPPNIYLPYIHDNPSTPETRTLSSEEARAALERDWIFQAGGKPLADRARDEIGWARALAARLAADPRTRDLGEDLAELDRLAARLEGGADPNDAGLYIAVRRTKRRIAFANPAIDFDRLLFIDQPQPAGPVNDIHEAIHRMGITATPGGRLLILDGLEPGGRVTKLAPDRPGSFWRPDLSFDATRILFCFKPHDEPSFHIYEIGIDGKGLRQVTDGDYDDLDPLYVPGGKIIFTTTRGNSYVRCGPFIYSTLLARCDADGGNVYLLSQGGEPDFVPSLMDDGRVIYSRWEYTDKPLWRVQSLWTTNQDGSGTAVFWGNQSVWPDHLSEPRQIPGSRRVIFSGVGHHDWWSGSIGIIDPERGFNFPYGLTKVTCDLRWPEASIPPLDPAESPRYHPSGPYTGYKTPYPLSPEDFLVSARGEGGKFRLYLMDLEGNRELIYEGVHHVLHAIPVRIRVAPPAHPDRVVWPGTGEERKSAEPGIFFSVDVCRGVPDLPRGMVKYLRVFQLDHKTYSTWGKTWRHSGPAVSVVQEEGVKRIITEVPVEDDGSVHFVAPAGRAFHFQLLDEKRRCLQTMRSFTGLMPGEVRGCLGCHEMHASAPPRRTGIALRRPPTPISPPPWGDESISYERFAQPVLDRHCGKCHQGDGEGRKAIDLTLRPGHDVFKEPYLTLVGGAGWGNPVPDRGQPGYGIAGAIPVESMDPTMNDPRAYATLRPLKYLSYTSPLIARAMGGEHHGVQIEGEDLRRLMAWVDACCPFLGEEELRALGDPAFAGIEELPIRPRVRTAPIVERP